MAITSIQDVRIVQNSDGTLTVEAEVTVDAAGNNVIAWVVNALTFGVPPGTDSNGIVYPSQVLAPSTTTQITHIFTTSAAYGTTLRAAVGDPNLSPSYSPIITYSNISNVTAIAQWSSITVSANIVADAAITARSVFIVQGAVEYGPFAMTLVSGTQWTASSTNLPSGSYQTRVEVIGTLTTTANGPSVDIAAFNGPVIGPAPPTGLPLISLVSNATAIVENQTNIAVIAVADSNQSTGHTFEITGVDAARFEAVPAATAGQYIVRFISAPSFETPLDANADNIYSLSIRAIDADSNASNSVALTAQVVNEIEAINVELIGTLRQGSSFLLKLTDELNLPIVGATAVWLGDSGGSISGSSNNLGEITILALDTAGQYNLAIQSQAITRGQQIVITDYPALASVTATGFDGGLVGEAKSGSAAVLDVDGNPASGVTITLELVNPTLATSAVGNTGFNGARNVAYTITAAGETIGRIVANRFGSTIESEPFSFFTQPYISVDNVAAVEAATQNPKYSEELFPYCFDFSDVVGADEIIECIVSVTCVSRPAKFDLNSQNMILGKPQIRGKKVLQFIAGGKRGATYVMRITVNATRSRPTAEIILKVHASNGRRAIFN